MTQVHVVANQKGGVGKTTVTVNLAAVTVNVLGGDPKNPPVLVVSTDPQASSVWWANRVEGLPFDFTQYDGDSDQLTKLRDMEKYAHIFVDTPGNLEDKNILAKALAGADDVIVPMPPEPLAFDPTARTISHVLAPRQIPYRVVVNAWDPRDGEADLEQTREYIAAQGWPVANVVVRRYKVHTRAAADGRVVTQYPKNRTSMEAREDFFRLALELGYGGR